VDRRPHQPSHVRWCCASKKRPRKPGPPQAAQAAPTPPEKTPAPPD